MDAHSTQAADSSSGAGPAGAQGAPAPEPGQPAGAPLWPSAPPTGEQQPPSAPSTGAHQAPGAPPSGGNQAPGAQSAAGPQGAPGDPNDWDGADTGAEETELPPSGLWAKMKADPEYAPEHLTLEAVTRLGPQAASWAERTRARYPGIPADTVAQIAVRRFTTFARLSGAAAGATGLPGAVIDIGVLAWTQARMVLHIAAAYNIDPTDPERATDLLVLQNVHKYTQTARTALAVARGNESADKLLNRKGPPPQMSQVFIQLGWKLAQMAGVRAAKKMFAKMIPGAAIILGTWANSSATTDLAKKAVALYRKAEEHPYQLPAGPHQP
jgi:hypothetical protein